MTTGEKIAKLRKENNYTQEQLAQLLGVSRQSISKYESDIAYPETDKLIQLGRIFDCSLDYLLKDEVETCQIQSDEYEIAENLVENAVRETVSRIINFDKKSKKMIGGLPLWHIGKHAKGIIAIGFTARGILSFGLCSIGVISFGVVSLGLLAMGALGLGILASGSIAVGIFACGGIAVGIASFGGISIADFAVGGLAIGKYFAYGDYAQGMHALGITEAIGECFEHLGELTAERKEVLISSMYENVPKIFHWIISLIAKVI